MRFNKLLEDIKRVRVQGAESIAIASAKAIKQLLKEGKGYKDLLEAKAQLLATRPTQPCTYNTLSFIFNSSDKKNFKEVISENIDKAINHFRGAREKIMEFGSNKISDGDVVFTHCHSSTVISILKRAKQRGKRFKVLCTETRPLYQGRLTAKEISRLKIPVTFFVDSAARFALKKADIMLIGADAVTAEGKVINKIGSELFAEIAFLLDKPVYVATDSWKFDPKSVYGFEPRIEKRADKEIWQNPPKNIKIMNIAFEKINPQLITAIISELEVLAPLNFVEEVKLHNPWIKP